MLSLDALLFVSTAIIDLALARHVQLPMALLRIAIAIVNAVAASDVWKLHRSLDSGEWGSDAWELPSVFAAQLSAAPILFIPLWVEVHSPFTDEFADIAVLVAAGALFLFALGVITCAIMRRPGVELNRAWTAVVALLPLAAVVQFWFVNFYKPAHDRPRVDVVAKLEELRHYGKVTHMRGTITLNNSGAAAVDVLGAAYTITGHSTEKSERLGANKTAHDVLDLASRDQRHLGEYKGLLKMDDVLKAGETLAPGQKWSTTFVFDASNDKQEVVRLTVHTSLLTHNGDSKVTNDCGEDFEGRVSPVCTQTDLPVPSSLHEVLGDRPAARTVMLCPPVGAPYLLTRYLSRDRAFKGETKEFKSKPGESEKIDARVRDQMTGALVEYRLDP
ncbi:hypothetical protein [Streptomyces sp. NPDC020681]|uniref:hypothetical protein n=1 Tax=Streptomyces sp. NPDC020681 TaxID=3365083 RepID=UPI00378A7A09